MKNSQTASELYLEYTTLAELLTVQFVELQREGKGKEADKLVLQIRGAYCLADLWARVSEQSYGL